MTPAMTSAQDARFMALALALGRRGLGRTWPNPAVGAVVARDSVIIGRGWTQPDGRPHAETEALRRAGAAARGATLYVTLEPCSHHGKTPPCADAIIAAGIARVVSALVDPNPEVAGAGHWRLAEAGVVVEVGVGAEEARRAHAGHIRRGAGGRPHGTLQPPGAADAARAREQALAAHGVDVARVPGTDGKLELAAVLKLLAQRGITRLMVESGPILAAAFLRADLVDEAALFRSPAVIGPDGIDALDGLPLSALTQSPRLNAAGS